MDIDDRGLGDLIYQLMLGQVDERLFPGLNLLVRDETQPGGACHTYRQRQEELTRRFRDLADEELCRLFLDICILQEDMYRRLAQIIFRYGLQLGPLLQRVPPDQPDPVREINRFWVLDDPDGSPPDPVKRAALGRDMLMAVAEYAGFIDPFTAIQASDPQEQRRLYDQQLDAVIELLRQAAPQPPQDQTPPRP